MRYAGQTIISTNYDSIFLELKQKVEQKTIHVNHANKENYNNSFSKDELTREIKANKNHAHGPTRFTMKC